MFFNFLSTSLFFSFLFLPWKILFQPTENIFFKKRLFLLNFYNWFSRYNKLYHTNKNITFTCSTHLNTVTDQVQLSMTTAASLSMIMQPVTPLQKLSRNNSRNATNSPDHDLIDQLWDEPEQTWYRRSHPTNHKIYSGHLSIKHHRALPDIQFPCLDGSELLWRHKSDLHIIRQVVSLMWKL